MAQDDKKSDYVGIIASWSKYPYGVRLPEDPASMFETLLQQEKYSLDAKHSDKNAKNLQQWFSILKTPPSDIDITSQKPDGGPPTFDALKLSLVELPNYTDTRVGGNEAINPYWQFNRDDDIVPDMLMVPNVRGGGEDYGMGRVYSERYDANQQILWLSMGVAEYTDLISFYMDSGDAYSATAMREGTIANIPGKILKLVVDGTIWAFTFPIQTGMWFYKWVARSDMTRVTKYYWFNPSMTLYYEMVNTMLSYLAVGMGLYPTMLKRMDSSKVLNEENTEGIEGYSTVVDAWGKGLNNVKYANETGIPEILQDGPDIFVIMNRRAALFDAARAKVTSRELLEAAGRGKDNPDLANKYFMKEDKAYALEEAESDGGVSKWVKKAVANTYSSIKETMFGAGDFVGFKIERSSNASESVSNDTGQSSIAQELNSISEKAKEEYESTLGGNELLRLAKKISANGTNAGFGAYLESVATRTATKLVGLAGMGDIGGIIANGNGFLNIPDVWKNSSFSKNYSFSIELNARYGDPVSIYQSIYIPMIMLLAASLPRSIGSSMYTSPFLVQAYCKGQFAIPCGIISSLDITRGKEEHGWNNNMLPTSVSISLSIKDLTPAMFLGMSDIGLFDTFTRNETMHEYLDTLSALGISERKFLLPQMLRKASAALLIRRNTIFSSTYWGGRIGRTGLAKALAYVAPFGNHENSDLKYNASTWN